MKTIGALMLLMSLAGTAWAQETSVPNVADEAGSTPLGLIFDQGAIVVDAPGTFSRIEDFVIFKRPDGGYAILSSISADDGSYQITASWQYDDMWRAKSASGHSKTNGVERKIEIRKSEGKAFMQRRTVSAGGEMRFDEFTAECGDDCLIDMSPAALPMSVMARRFDAQKGGAQAFKWVGVSLIADQVLTDGLATISRNRTLNVDGAEITHWRFVEDLKDPAGNPMQMNAHLWTDAAGHLRKFGMGRNPKPTTVGIRESDTPLSAQMPAE
ncbi:MAG: hypothetical protein JNK21_10045 [Rhodospirillaceae bacterium]|nr:hypothetical protein [Rhodospirillaceae bacterium]